MKRTIFLLSLLPALFLQAEDPPRNPFWAQGYEGLRYPITTEPRIKPKPKTAAPKAKTIRKAPTASDVQSRIDAEAKARESAKIAEENNLWQAAGKTLKLGGTMGFGSADEKKVAITINGRIYVIGDRVSCNCGEYRFTWKIESLTPEGKLKLKRVKFGAIKSEHK